MSEYDPEPEFVRLVQQREPMTVRDLDLDAFADGLIAHRAGRGFHENPWGMVPTVRRLSWTFGWNERALQQDACGSLAGVAIGTLARASARVPNAGGGDAGAGDAGAGDAERGGALITVEDLARVTTAATLSALQSVRHNLALFRPAVEFSRWLDAEIESLAPGPRSGKGGGG